MSVKALKPEHLSPRLLLENVLRDIDNIEQLVVVAKVKGDVTPDVWTTNGLDFLPSAAIAVHGIAQDYLAGIIVPE